MFHGTEREITEKLLTGVRQFGKIFALTDSGEMCFRNMV